MTRPGASRRPVTALLALLLAVPLLGQVVETARPGEGQVKPAGARQTGPFRDRVVDLVASAEASGSAVVRGRDGFLFFVPELRSLSVGPFWGPEAALVSRASRREHADPMPAIVDFHRQLAAAGVALILVPVPAKLSVYPDRLFDGPNPATGVSPPQLVDALRSFYALLRSSGVHVLDLTPELVSHRDDAEGTTYCRQDTHWSARACAIAARSIRAAIGEPAWLAGVPKHRYETEPASATITGDLWRMLGDASLAREAVPLTRVSTPSAAGLQPIAPWRDSPVLLLGDSHARVFHAGEDLHGTGAGLADHLALSLGFPVDLVAVRGSGATSARIDLLRRRDNLAGKKVVVWCFGVRELTEAQEGWRVVQVMRD